MTPLEHDLLQRLEATVTRVDDLLGSDLLDPTREVAEDRIFDRVRTYASQLTDPDPAVARQAAVALGDLVDTRDPTDAGTPLGIAVASTEDFEGQLLSQAEAAHLLGVSRQWVNDLLRHGRLERVGKRVTRTSVARELAKRATTPLHLVELIDHRGEGQRQYLTDTGGWVTSTARARHLATLKDARRVANDIGAYARGVTVQSPEARP